MKIKVQFSVLAMVCLGAVSSLQGGSTPAASLSGEQPQKTAASPSPAGESMPVSKAAREEKAIQDARRQKIAEKEAALAAKEEELKKLSDKLETQLKSIDDTKKKYEEMVKAEEERQKQLRGERVTKMIKLFKTMKADKSAQLLDNMEETEVKLVLDRLDTKTVAKLVPNLNQPRTIRWVNENLMKRTEKK